MKFGSWQVEENPVGIDYKENIRRRKILEYIYDNYVCHDMRFSCGVINKDSSEYWS